VPRLSDMTVKTTPIPASGRTTLWDDGSPLGVRITSNGAKTFIVMIGSGRRHTIGRYGDITLAEARAAAQRIKAEKTLGRVFPESVTLASARELYLSHIDVRPNTREYYVHHLGKLKAGNLADITIGDINRILDLLPSPSRTQALASFRPFFKWCNKRNYLTRSPCELLTAKGSPARDRVLTDAEIKAIWNVTGDGKIFSDIVRLLLLTGQRRGEIAQLQTSWINETNIIFPKEAVKNNREHRFPIGAFCAAQLAEMRKKHQHASGYIFFAKTDIGGPFNGWMKSKLALDKKLGPDFAPWTLHDCRRTFATNMAKLGVRLEVTERLLNHVSGSLGGIVGVYQKYDFQSEMFDTIALWEAKLSQIVS
jgi:integrase